MIKETDDKYEIDIEIQCSSCTGTGLYVGRTERDGAAVVCHTCKGTGKSKFVGTFPKFKGRIVRKDVKRVFSSAGGYVISVGDVMIEDGRVIQFSTSGVDYREWLKGGKPKPLEPLHCPCQHTGQSIRDLNHPAHKLWEERCSGANLLGASISTCKLRPDKKTCWKRYYELVKEEP